jgi:hypothetical protein
MKTYTKDPEAIKDYSVNWSEWLEGDAVETSAWDVPEGLTLVTESLEGARATVRVSGGSAGKVYTLRNTITTKAGLRDVRSLGVRVRRQ